MFCECNPNPLHRSVGDCTIRAVSIALDQPWDKTYWDICQLGFDLGDMPSANHVWGEYLKSRGLRRHTAPDLMTVSEFCRSHPHGTYVLGCDSHVVCAIDGIYYDAWDSGEDYVVYYWE